MERSSMRVGWAILCATMLTVLSNAVQMAVAADVAVTNGNFEDPPLEDNNFTAKSCGKGDPICVKTNDTVIGWTVVGTAGTWNPTAVSYPGGVPGGANVAYANQGSVATISQALEEVLQANVFYTLAVDIGRRADDNFAGYRVQLWAGATLLAEDDNSLLPAPGTFEQSVISVSVGSEEPDLGENLEIVLVSMGRQTNFDNVTLVTDVFPFPGDGYPNPDAWGVSGHGPALNYTDNGDLTVTDNVTRFIWEVKLAADGSDGGHCDALDQMNRSVHCENNVYTWTEEEDSEEADGTLWTEFLYTLNNTCSEEALLAFNDPNLAFCESDLDCTQACGFAGHRDWEIPNIKKLESIVDYSEFNPAINPSFPGATVPGSYWSATKFTRIPDVAWSVNFSDGNDLGGRKTNPLLARAVRNGSE